VRLRIVKIEAFIILKAFAMADRTKDKDAYDIYFCLKHFSTGVAELAQLYRPMLHNGLVREGIAILHDKFATIDSVGPLWAAQIAHENDGVDRDIAQRDAFELMSAFLAALDEQQVGGA